MAHEFVKGWYLLDILGEGRFGEVRLLMNKESKEMVAAKIVKVSTPEQEKAVNKELAIHKLFNHENIIGIHGNRRWDDLEYIFLEYASGGELFDRIEPDKGVSHTMAYRFFHELINGIEYMHSRGIVHRDIKPENLLLDSNDTLKISDFGFATVFRHNGKTRRLDQRCGSIYYMAPEVLSGEKHEAEPIDIWSCGVVLFAMLTGELPWEEASPELCPAYKNYLFGKTEIHKIPWCKLRNDAFTLIKNVLCPFPSKRYRISNIRKNKWFTSKPPTQVIENSDYNFTTPKRRCHGFLSQPMASDTAHETSEENASPLQMVCSQPLNLDDMVISTQSQPHSRHTEHSQENLNTQPSTRLYLKLVRRLTRFWTKLNFDNTIQILIETFDQLELSYKQTRQFFTITMKDRGRRPLVFRASVNQMLHNKVLVDFRLAKGDGLEFKRQFTNIRQHLNQYIEPFSSTSLFGDNSDSFQDPFGDDCF